MTTPLSQAQFERLRRDAKRYARDNAIPLHQAQQHLAAENGYSNWSLLAKAANAASGNQAGALVAPVTVRVPLGRQPANIWRYYLHGDLHEDQPGRYYCARCDDLFLVDHFQVGGEHADQKSNFERILIGLERWEQRRYERWSDRRRPDDALNLFADDARAAQTAFDSSRSGFHKWIETQRNRDDPVGDLATEIMRDRGFPVGLGTRAELRNHLRRHGMHVLDALDMAWADYPKR